MDWLQDLLWNPNSVAHIVFLYAFVVAAGVYLGKIKIFGESHVDEAAKELGVPVLGKLPVDPKKAEAADAGEFYRVDNPELADAVEVLKKL